MSAAIAPDVLELLERIRREQGAPIVYVVDDALVEARRPMVQALRSSDEARRALLVQGAAWALYALELNDAAAEEAHRAARGRT